MAAYRPPGWMTKNVFNPLVALFTEKLGISVDGANVLAVRGRRSGAWRTVPVYPLPYQGQRYLVAPRGDTEWVRNLRAAGSGELRLGKRRRAFRAEEVPDAEKPPLLRAYLKRWGHVTTTYWGDLKKDSSDQDIRRAAPNHPVFRIQ